MTDHGLLALEDIRKTRGFFYARLQTNDNIVMMQQPAVKETVLPKSRLEIISFFF